MLRDIDSRPGPSPYLKKLVKAGKLGFKSGEGFRKWSPAQQQAMTDAAAATEQWASKMTWDTADRAMDVLRKQGMEIVEPDLSGFRKVAEEVTQRFDGEMWSKGTLQKIQAVR